jgi:hypothetical protein
MNEMQMLVVAALVVWMIVKRFAGSPVGARGLLVPVGLTAYGLYEMHGAQFGAVDIALLAAELVVGVVAGALRGMTIKLYPRNGHLWQRYGAATLVVWVAMIAMRFAFGYAAHGIGATLPAGAAVMATFGVSILVETLVVQKRALATGVPIMPQPARRTARVR